jgi:hypothetical protein
MAGTPSKRKQGNRALRLSTMKKHGAGNGSDGLTHGGSAKIGRTIEVKGHPSHPGLDFVAPRGPAHGKKVPDKKLTATHTRKKPKAVTK